MIRITVDTNILIWGLRGWAMPNQQDRIGQAQRLFAELVAARDDVVLTSQVVAEFLTGGTPLERARQLRTLSDRFQILPFDTNAAAIAAKLRSDKDYIKYLGDEIGKTRACIKSDIVIVATALAHNVQQIVSEDAGVGAIARREGLLYRGLEAPPAPPKSRGGQQSQTLFTEADDSE